MSKTLNDPKRLFRRESIEAKDLESMGQIVLARPISLTLLTACVLLFLLLVMVTLVFGEYSRQELVQGRLIPEGDFARIYSPKNGVVSELYVEEGDAVEQDQPLALIQTDVYSDDGSSLSASVAAEFREILNVLEANIADKRRLNRVRREKIQAEIKAKEAELKDTHSLLDAYEKRLEISRQDYERHQKLLKSQQISKVDFNKAHKDFLTAKIERDRLAKDARTLENQIDQLRYDNRQQGLTAKNEIADLELRVAEMRKSMLVQETEGKFLLKAPISGMVTGLEFHRGRRVPTNKPMMTLLAPDAHLRAELYVPTKAIGFVTEQTPVKLRYAAFPYQKFGTYVGRIETISKTIFLSKDLDHYSGEENSFYKISVSLPQQFVKAYDRDIPLQAGMELSAYIVGEPRSLLEWFFEPLFAFKKKYS